MQKSNWGTKKAAILAVPAYFVHQCVGVTPYCWVLGGLGCSCDGGPGDPVLRESSDSHVVWRSAALVRPAPPAHLSAVFVDGSALKDTCGSMCLHVGPGSEGGHERALELL